MEEKLIESVREYSELYDTTHANYMKTKLKNKIWREIARNLNLKDGEEAKTSWLKLRGSYRDARRRQMRCLKSGAAPETIKPWRFQNQMSFLKQFSSTGPREGSFNVDSDDDVQLPHHTTSTSTPAKTEVLESEEIEGGNNLHENGRDLSHIVSNSSITNNSEESPKEIESIVSHTIRSTSLMQQKHPKNKKQDYFRNHLKRSTTNRNERIRHRIGESNLLESNSITRDPLYNFFISMYQLTSSMPPKYQHRIRCQLFQAVSQAEEEIFSVTSCPPSTMSSYSHNSASSGVAQCSPYSPASDPQQQIQFSSYSTHNWSDQQPS